MIQGSWHGAVPFVALAALLAVPDAHAEEHAPPHYTELLGSLEFSGQMIVRPTQSSTLRSKGLTTRQVERIGRRAALRLLPYAIEHVAKTDEFIVTVPAGETENSYAATLMATGDYEYAVPNWICHPTESIPNDGGYASQWHHPKLQSSLAWDITTGDSAIVIAIIDGGINLEHDDLAAALVPGYNAADRLAQQDGGDVSDVDGHGTFVAGIAGAIGNNGAHVVGIGWHFSLMPVRYYNTPGGGLLSDVLNGARWAADHGAKCINVSQTGVEFEPVQTTGEYIRNQGGLLFYAAGNDGRDLSWFDWDDVIVVGGTDPNDARTSCSAYGLAVDVFAPGIDILSTGIEGGLALSGCGTSAATPMAAGVAALVWSMDQSLTPTQVERHLLHGSDDLGPPGEDAEWGWGRANAHASVLRLAGTVPTTSQWGIVLMILGVLTTGTLVCGPRKLTSPQSRSPSRCTCTSHPNRPSTTKS